MKIIRAAHLGMCFGVRDAIALAKKESNTRPVTVLGELVHNQTVLRDLSSHGVRFAGGLNGVTTPNVMITAHGASDRAIQGVRERGFNVIEATCPLVHFAHRELRHLVKDGFHPVIIGQRDHVEVRGMTGDLDEFDVVLSDEDVLALQARPRFGIVSQTTQPIARVSRLVELLRTTFPNSEVEFRDTVCQPTKQRQRAAMELAEQSDVVVVVGGANSNNTKELVATCARRCSRVHHVQTANDLRAEWFEGAEVVGVTAGTSTPDCTIDAVERELEAMVVTQRAAA
jgi:4-hydroxy-3-methylbut-2-en-1-yl diphosphate reductase